jgi:PKD repeat protein
VCSFVSTSTDDAGVVSASWTFGDGTVGSGYGVSHTYANRGTYTVGLTVRDAAGLASTTYKSVSIKQSR